MIRPLFVAGCPRSGTTALAEYLNEHEEILVCIERYKYAPASVTPSHFAFERILDYRDGETNIPRERHARLLARKDPARLRWAGDKMPTYYRWYLRLLENNPGARFIVIHRPVEEVAESFQARARNPEDTWPHDFERGVRNWNQAVKLTRAFIESDREPRLLLLNYQDFFYDNEVCAALLSRFLDVEFDERVLERWRERSLKFENKRRRKEPLSVEQARYIEGHKAHRQERWLLRHMQRQRTELLGAGA